MLFSEKSEKGSKYLLRRLGLEGPVIPSEEVLRALAFFGGGNDNTIETMVLGIPGYAYPGQYWPTVGPYVYDNGYTLGLY